MQLHVDWLSIVLPIPTHTDRQLPELMRRAINDQSPELADVIGMGWGEFQQRKGRPPYNVCYFLQQGIDIYMGKPDNMLIEIKGTGCDYLRKQGVMTNVIRRHSKSLTRIDIAADIRTEISPTEFVRQAESKRWRSRSTITSETGQTEYVGSRKSERFARVYRYAAPHPRSDVLRVEMVNRKGYAKAMGQFVVEHGLVSAAEHLTSVYGWESPLWHFQAVKHDIETYRADRPQSKTVRWLIAQVAPAFKRLVDDGTIEDGETFLKQHFL